MVHMSRFV
ncbi:hypothetical protein LINPERPRIM_LOCUS22092 [Linum perenne]